MLDDAELIERIAAGESDRVEFTASTTDLDKFRQAICAFANDLPGNGEPGLLVIGLEDDGRRAGSVIHDGLLQTLGGLRTDGKILPFPVMEVARKQLSNCDVAVVQVEPSENPPIKVDGRCWIRIGPRRAQQPVVEPRVAPRAARRPPGKARRGSILGIFDRGATQSRRDASPLECSGAFATGCQATAEDERRLTEKRRWGNLPYDMQGVDGATVDADLDMRAFERDYLPCAVSPEVLAENRRDRGEQLRALRLVAPNGAPTVTAVLVLGRDPRYWFPGAYQQFVRYAGTAVTDGILDHAELSGPLPEQLREADRLLRLNIARALDTRGERHVEKPDYPYEALRELLRNAAIHRNYENSHTPVRISWLADRVEILSPGSAFGEVGRDNFGRGATSYRNPTVAEAMRNMGFMQRFGIGIETARTALAENGNPPPEFDVQDTFVLVTVRRRP